MDKYGLKIENNFSQLNAELTKMIASLREISEKCQKGIELNMKSNVTEKLQEQKALYEALNEQIKRQADLQKQLFGAKDETTAKQLKEEISLIKERMKLTSQEISDKGLESKKEEIKLQEKLNNLYSDGRILEATQKKIEADKISETQAKKQLDREQKKIDKQRELNQLQEKYNKQYLELSKKEEGLNNLGKNSAGDLVKKEINSQLSEVKAQKAEIESLVREMKGLSIRDMKNYSKTGLVDILAKNRLDGAKKADSDNEKRILEAQKIVYGQLSEKLKEINDLKIKSLSLSEEELKSANEKMRQLRVDRDKLNDKRNNTNIKNDVDESKLLDLKEKLKTDFNNAFALESKRQYSELLELQGKSLEKELEIMKTRQRENGNKDPNIDAENRLRVLQSQLDVIKEQVKAKEKLVNDKYSDKGNQGLYDSKMLELAEQKEKEIYAWKGREVQSLHATNAKILAQEKSKLSFLTQQANKTNLTAESEAKLLAQIEASKQALNEMIQGRIRLEGIGETGVLSVRKQAEAQEHLNRLIEKENLLRERNSEKARITELNRVSNLGTKLNTPKPVDLNMNTGEITRFVKELYGAGTEVTSFKNKTDNAGNKVREFTVNVKDANGVLRTHKVTLDNNTKALYDIETGARQASSQVDKMGTSFGTLFKGLSAVEIAKDGLRELGQELKRSFNYVVELDKAQTDLQIVSGRSKETVEKLSNSYNDLAKNLHESQLNMIEGATEFLRAGLKEEDVENMLNVSTKASKIAGEDQKQVAEKLIAIMNGFKIESDNMMGYADKMVYMGNATATSFGEISSAIQRTANSAQLAGSDFDHLVAYISSVSETTRQSAETIGNAYKSMYSRFQDVKGGKDFDAESGEAISNVESALNRQGIALRNSAKEFRKYDDVIQEVAGRWKEFDDIAKSDIAKALAGTRQREFFVVMMENYDKILQYQKDMKESIGSTDEAYKIYADSLEAKIEDFKNSVSDLRKQLMNSETAKSLVEGATKLIEKITEFIKNNDELIKQVLKGIGVFLAFKLAIAGLNGILKPFKGDLEGVTGVFGLLSTVLGGATGTGIVGGLASIVTGFKGLMTVLATINPLIGVIAFAIGGLATILLHHANSTKKAKEEANKLSDAYKNLGDNIKNGNISALEDYEKLKKQEDELSAKIKRRDDLTKKINQVKPNLPQAGDPNYQDKMKDYNAWVNEQRELNNEIETSIERYKQAGINIEENTGKVTQLKDAFSDVANLDIKHMADETFKDMDTKIAYTIEHKDEVRGLINEYFALVDVEDKQAWQQERLQQITSDLTGKVGGLITTVDEHGRITIQNSGILRDHIGWLDTEGITHEKLAQVVAQEARDYLMAQDAKTAGAGSSISARLKMYQAEAEALQGTIDIQNKFGKASSWVDPITGKNFLKDKSQDRLNEVKGEIGKIKDLQGYINGLGGGGNGYVPAPSTSYGGGGGYMPSDGGGGSSSGGKGSSGSSASQREYETNIERLNLYEMRLTRINEVLESQKDILDSLNREREKYQAIGYTDDQEHYAIGKTIHQYDTYIKQIKNEQRVLGTIQNDIAKEFKGFAGLDITKYTQIQLEKVYSDKYGGKRTFKDEASQKAFEAQAKRFKDLIDQWDSAKDKSKELVEQIHNAEVEKLNLIKEYWDKAFAIQEERLDKYRDKIEKTQNKLDMYDVKVDVDKLTPAQSEERNKIIEELKKQSEEYRQVLIEQTSWLEAQRIKLKEGSQEWEAITEKIKENNKEILNVSGSIKDLNDKISASKDNTLNVVKSIEDRVINILKKKYEEIIKKEEERHNKTLENLEKEKNAQLEIIDAKIKSMDKEKNENDYNKQLNTKLEEKAKLQAQLDALSLDNSVEANAMKQDLLEQLKDKDKEIVDMQENYAFDKRKENLNDQKDLINKEYDERKKKLEKEFEDYKKTLEKKLENDSLYAEAKTALMNGFFTDAEGNIKNLADALLEYEDKFGEGLSVLGDKIKSEIIENLLKVQDLLENGFDWGKDNEDIKNPNKGEGGEGTLKKGMTIFGNDVDIANAKDVIARIEKETGRKLDVKFGTAEEAKNAQKGDIVLGGLANDFKDNKDITGITGSDRYDTANKLESFLTGSTKRVTILGRGVDVENARKVVKELGVKADIIDLNKTPRSPKKGDIVLGGEASKYPVSSGIIKLTGDNRYQTEDMLRTYLENAKGYSDGGVIDFTGIAPVHGGVNNAETVFNAGQSKELYEFVKNQIPRINSSFNQQKMANSVMNGQLERFGFRFDKLINVEGNVDKSVMPRLEETAKGTLNMLKREFNKRGIY